MEQSVHAIVLRRRDQGESDRRLTILTPELGKLDVVAKGARKGGSRLAGVSDPLSVAILGLAVGKRIRYVTQAQPVTSFRGLRTDYDRLQLGLALCELYAAVIPAEEPDPSIYSLLVRSLAAVEAHERPLVASIWAQVRLLQDTGFLPDFQNCVVTGSEVKEAEPFVSPHAGGYVSEFAAGPYTDRFRTRAEVLYGLVRLPEFEDLPPQNLRFAPQTLATLLPFWRNIAGNPLPANEAVVAEWQHLKGS